MTRMVLKGVAVVLVVGGVAAAIAGGAITIQKHRAADGSAELDPPFASDARPDHQDVALASGEPEPITDSGRGAVVAEPVPAGLRPLIPDGRTDLSDTVYAVYADGEVHVHFDTPMGRTRRPDKFEIMVRSTLARIYGPGADSALAQLPYGFLGGQGDLIDELPVRGFAIAISEADTVMVWPETRDGRDGPLVVAYRAVVKR